MRNDQINRGATVPDVGVRGVPLDVEVVLVICMGLGGTGLRVARSTAAFTLRRRLQSPPQMYSQSGGCGGSPWPRAC